MVNITLFQVSLVLYALGTVHYLIYLATQKKGIERIAVWLTGLALCVQTLFLIVRGIEGGHFPITNLFEALNFFVWAIVLCYFILLYRFRVGVLGTLVFPIALLLMVVSMTQSKELAPLVPVLQSKWLWVHTTFALLGYAFFVLAFAGGVLYLVQERQLKRHTPGTFFHRLPSLELLDRLHYRSLTLGFPLLTLGLITGAVWAEYAWGSYWKWDPKEALSLVTWLIYAALVHMRITVGWRGRKAAYVSVIGFVVVLLTFLGVSLLPGGRHKFD